MTPSSYCLPLSGACKFHFWIIRESTVHLTVTSGRQMWEILYFYRLSIKSKMHFWLRPALPACFQWESKYLLFPFGTHLTPLLFCMHSYRTAALLLLALTEMCSLWSLLSLWVINKVKINAHAHTRTFAFGLLCLPAFNEYLQFLFGTHLTLLRTLHALSPHNSLIVACSHWNALSDY